MKPKHCIGYGEHEGRCSFPIAKNSLHWCERCEALRRERITRQLEDLVGGFGTPAAALKEGNADG